MIKINVVRIEGKDNVVMTDANSNEHLFNTSILEQNEALKSYIDEKISFQSTDIQRVFKDLRQQIQDNSIPRKPKFLTKIPSIPLQFVGRVKEIDELHSKLKINKRGIVIRGIGGLGKTTLILKYISQKKEEYDHILFIEQDTNIDNAIAFEEYLSTRLGLKFENEISAYQRTKVILDSLEKLRGNHLLIIDNADHSILKLKGWVNTLENWTILITSRQYIDTFEIFDIPNLSKQELVTLFCCHVKNVKNVSIIEKIIENMDYHTLTIELIAKNTKELGIELEKLLEDLQEHGLDMADVTDIPDSQGQKYLTIIEHLFDRFALNLDEQYLKILIYFSVIPSQKRDRDFLIKLFGYSDNVQLFNKALSFLVRNGWITKSDNYYECHNVIRQVVKAKILPRIDICDDLVKGVLTILRPGYKNGGHGLFRVEYLEIGETIYKNIIGDSVNLSIIANIIALVLRDIGDYEKSLEYFKQSLHLKQKHLVDLNHPLLALAYNNLAVGYKNIGNYKEALNFAKKGLEIRMKEPKSQDLLATSFGNMASILLLDKKFDEALSYASKDIAIKEEIMPNSPLLAISYNCIASIYNELSDFETALKYALLSEKINSEKLALESPRFGIMLVNLAQINININNIDKAEQYIIKANAILGVLAENHQYRIQANLVSNSIIAIKQKQ